MARINNAWQGIAESHGGSTMNFGVTPSGGARTSNASAAISEDVPTTIVVFIAKDKEFTSILRHINNCSKNKETDGPLTNYRNKKVILFGRGVLFVECDAMGPKAWEVVKELLTELRPKYVGTIGFCGGKKPELGKARIFYHAIVRTLVPPKEEEDEVEKKSPPVKDETVSPPAKDEEVKIDPPSYKDEVFSATRRVGAEAVWREMQDEVVRDVEAKILTVDRLVKDVDAVLVDGIVAVDMEIGQIFKAVRNYNRVREKADEAEMLPAIKGISDNGEKEDRDKHFGAKALKNAAEAFVVLVKNM